MMQIPTGIVQGDRCKEEYLLHVATHLRYQILMENKTFKEQIPNVEPEYRSYPKVTADEWICVWDRAKVRA
ncbi:hypothetical protein [Pseudomonas phage LUZ7]|uniref:Uncharacterized protein n=1 Tax=Pseudomonas phage LUZ7 TaxID=655097 RepID=C8ZKJ4_9CAUD|nr:hypothetical protein PP-LUZ7_gp095 [Pseudomonas phage LUZ7]CAZ66236.1 hypothetical protein [Pseudomonas phage LUZ7]